jgi:ribonuclease HI
MTETSGGQGQAVEHVTSAPQNGDGLYHLYTDGACPGGLGLMGAGVLLITPQGEEIPRCKSMKRGTSQIAEYEALLFGLWLALQRGARRLRIYMDSQLVARQLTGIYQVRAAHLRPLWKRAMNQLERLDSYEIIWIPRDLNDRADALANRALRAAYKK